MALIAKKPSAKVCTAASKSLYVVVEEAYTPVVTEEENCWKKARDTEVTSMVPVRFQTMIAS